MADCKENYRHLGSERLITIWTWKVVGRGAKIFFSEYAWCMNIYNCCDIAAWLVWFSKLSCDYKLQLQVHLHQKFLKCKLTLL